MEFLKSQRNKFNKRATGKGWNVFNVLKFVHYIYDVFKYAGFVVLKKSSLLCLVFSKFVITAKFEVYKMLAWGLWVAW